MSSWLNQHPFPPFSPGVLGLSISLVGKENLNKLKTTRRNCIKQFRMLSGLKTLSLQLHKNYETQA